MKRGLPAGDEAGRVHWGENGGGVLNALLENLDFLVDSREIRQNVVHWRREWQTTSVFLP